MDEERSDDRGPGRPSSDQEASLLLREHVLDQPGQLEKGTIFSPDGKYDDKSVCGIDRWWKLVLFLVLWIVLIPTIVRWTHHDHDSIRTVDTISSATASQNDYVLDNEWDFDAPPQTRDYVWTIAETEYNPDGVYRPMILINNQYPGPLVRVNEFDTVRVKVINQGSNATSVHWHGLYQNGTNHMDGTVGVTQCPIGPGQTFTYEFKVRGQSGTYWYHGHVGVQASDGLVGPFIIHAREEKNLQKLQYDTDRVVMISDHYHDLSSALTRQYLAPDQENVEPVPDGILINGQAVRDCSSLPHRKCDNTTDNVQDPVFDLAPNQQHRLRIINVGAFAEFEFQIDEHELAVTEVDGTDVHPEYYHRLQITPAQRYSVVINTNLTSSEAFWMRARMTTTCFGDVNPFMVGELNAVVRYTTVATTPNTKDWSETLSMQCRDLNTTNLRPVHAIAAPAKEDAFFYLRANFEIGAYRLSRGFFNSSRWQPNVYSPTLSRAIDGLQTDNNTFTSEQTDSQAFVNDQAFDISRELVIQSSGVQTLDFLIYNFEDKAHPLHLHGYKFFVLAQGHGAPPHTDKFRGYDRANLEPLYSSLDLTNPLRRDTASVEGYGWMLIRLVADNPGVWAFHCHISWHTEAGLLMQIMTRTDLLQQQRLPEEHAALCLAPGLEKGAAPKDEDYYAEAMGD